MTDEVRPQIEKSKSEEALFKETPVLLANGTTLFIRPWGVQTGQRMMTRIRTMLKVAVQIYGGKADIGEILESSYNEIVAMASDTVGIPVDDLYDENRYLLEDLFGILEVIVKVNFIDRPGMVKKLVSLLGLVEQAFMPDPEMATDDPEAPSEIPIS